jgi:hypothetical protein
MIAVSTVNTRSYDKMAKVELRCGDGEKETLNQQSIPFPVPIRCSCKRSSLYTIFLLKDLSQSGTVPLIFDLTEEL